MPRSHLFHHVRIVCPYLQRSAKVGAPGLVNIITAVAYHFCPSLPAAFTQPGASTLADLCMKVIHFEKVIGKIGKNKTPTPGGLRAKRSKEQTPGESDSRNRHASTLGSIKASTPSA